MKRTSLFITSFFICLSFQACKNEETQIATSIVSFALTVPGNPSGRIVSDFEGASIVLTLESPMGDAILTQSYIKLLAFGSDYISEPLELVPGDYVITEFMVVRDSSEVEYVTPLAGSRLSSVVKHALPIHFHVARDKAITLEIEVIPADAHEPEDFGYASFHTSAIRPLSIVVFGKDRDFILINAKASFLQGTDTISSYALKAKVNVIPFKEDPYANLRLVVEQDGYRIYSAPFNYNEVTNDLGESPLRIFLDAGLTMDVNTFYGTNFDFALTTEHSAKLAIDWGDGIIDSIDTSPDVFVLPIHDYPPIEEVTYKISITGELNKIKGFVFDHTGGRIDHINFDHVPELGVANFFGSDLKELDLRLNHKLRHVVFGGYSLKLPQTSNLAIVVLYNAHMAPILNSIVHIVYLNAVSKNITEGYFEFYESPDGGGIPLGTINDQSLGEISDLTATYNWTVQPLP